MFQKAVGKNAPNHKSDVTYIQTVFSDITINRKPLWCKKPDGRRSKELEAAICVFQCAHKMRATGRLEATLNVRNALMRSIPTHKRKGLLNRTFGTLMTPKAGVSPDNFCCREADKIDASAPMPSPECRSLARALRTIGIELKVYMKPRRYATTQDGRFEVELAFDTPLKGPVADQNTLKQRINRYVTSSGIWQSPSPPHP